MIEIDHIDAELVRRILNVSPYGILVVEEENVVYVNKKLEEMFDIEKERLIGNGTKDLEKEITLKSEVKNGLKEITEYVWENSEPILDEKIHVLKDGKKIFANMDIVPILNEGKGSRRLVFYFRDVLEEKYSAVWSKIHEFIEHPILILDKDQKIIDVNKAVEKILDMSSDEIKDKYCYEVLHESEKPPDNCPFLKMLESSDMETQEMEVEALGRYFLVSCTPVFDIKGEIDSVIHICTDITEEKIAKKKLKASESKYRQLFETSKDGIAVTDLEGNIVDCNDAFLEIIGYDSFDEVKGMSYKKFTPEQYHEMEEKIIKSETLIKGSSKEYEKEYLTKEGNRVDVEIRGWIRKDSDGKPIGMWVLVRDITDRKKTEEREEFLHSLLRHDLKNKINVMQGYHVLLEDMVDEEGQEILDKLEKVISSSKRLIEMVRKLAKLEKVESLDEVNLNTYLVDAVYSNRDSAEEKGFTIDMEVDSYRVEGGPLLEELFLNIISNAIKHSGGDNIKISTIEEENKVTVRIEDNGKGIDKDERDDILKKGYIGTGSDGTGLGLYLCKKILETYESRMNIKDSEMGGACFELIFNKA